MKIKNFSQSREFLFSHIPESLSQIFTAGFGLKRTKYFLRLLGSPQNKLKVIHVAGTSGKGSTAYLTSLILKSLGLKVGLTLSPHLRDIRERVQIDGRFLSKQKFTLYLSKLTPFIDKMKATSFGLPTYFEILISLAFYTFLKEKVDYAVVETGLGGLYDATNTVSNKNKVVILTKIGFDHTWILGKTLSDITQQKAGIIQNGNAVISLWQKTWARKIIEEVALKKKARLFWVGEGGEGPSLSSNSQLTARFSKVKVTPKFTTFNFYAAGLKMKEVELGLLGLHQAENCCLALATTTFLSQRDGFKFEPAKVKRVLKKAHFPGRLEAKKINNKTVVIDGAHNPQKMAALTMSLKKIWPGQKFNFLIAIKKGKDYSKMLKYIVCLANQVVVTSFTVSCQDLVHQSENPQEIIKVLERLGYENFKLVPDLKKALKMALSIDHDRLVITGSLYLLAEIYPLLEQTANTGS